MGFFKGFSKNYFQNEIFTRCNYAFVRRKRNFREELTGQAEN